MYFGHISCFHLFGQPLEVLSRLPDVTAVGQPAVEGPAWEKKENRFFYGLEMRGGQSDSLMPFLKIYLVILANLEMICLLMVSQRVEMGSSSSEGAEESWNILREFLKITKNVVLDITVIYLSILSLRRGG